jgi:hypothetical protein
MKFENYLMHENVHKTRITYLQKNSVFDGRF